MTIFTVSTASDSVDAGDGKLSLREAVTQANATVATDTILFDATIQSGTFRLTGGHLTVGTDVTIDGGTGVTIDADGKSRVLLVQGDGTQASIRHVTVTGGMSDVGGGIFLGSFASLALDHVEVVGNAVCNERYTASGGGIYSTGELTLSRCLVASNRAIGDTASGGGICSVYGSVAIDRSTVADNLAAGVDDGRGGGVSSLAELTLTNSTIHDNQATGEFASGGGLYGHTLTLVNATVAGNLARGSDDRGSSRASGGGIYGTYLSVTNSTITGNDAVGDLSYGGGIAGSVFYGQLRPVNALFVGNSAQIGADLSPHLAVRESNGHNIFGSSVAGAVAGDLQIVPTSLLFAGGLGDNGGPTQTIALRDALDNPALAGADPADAPATDQRYVARPQPARTAPDIGAFELDQTIVAYNPITGTDRGEFLSGTRGPDLMRGLGGNDRLWGRTGDDLLFGNAGKDVLAGKAGIDQITGGSGADRLLYRRPIDAPPDGPILDQIMDFSRDQHDKVVLRPIDADQGAHGNQKFAFIGAKEFTRAGQLRYEEVADGQFLLSGTTDRDLAAEFAFVVHADVAGLKASDFLL